MVSCFVGEDRETNWNSTAMMLILIRKAKMRKRVSMITALEKSESGFETLDLQKA
jgi:hypothetical protein